MSFTVASALCGLAPSLGALVVDRALQGIGGALLVPGSLALLSASFAPEDRSPAFGAWSGLAGAFSALGPFLGGWLVDAASYRSLGFYAEAKVSGCTSTKPAGRSAQRARRRPSAGCDRFDTCGP